MVQSIITNLVMIMTDAACFDAIMSKLLSFTTGPIQRIRCG